jgi:MOSC domain-containing protein YiiM
VSGLAAKTGRVLATCIGDGGIPNHPVPVARVDERGLAGDAHRFHLHGGADRAVCLFSIEDCRALERDGVTFGGPGAFGENLLVEGLDFRALRAGDLLEVGETVVLEIFDVREPCGTLKRVDPRLPNLMVGRSGFVCRVREPGELRPGQTIAHRPGAIAVLDAAPGLRAGPSERCPGG